MFQEPVRIEGCFRGEVSSIDLVVIATEDLVEGRVRAPRLLILGELRGDFAERFAWCSAPPPASTGGSRRAI